MATFPSVSKKYTTIRLLVFYFHLIFAPFDSFHIDNISPDLISLRSNALFTLPAEMGLPASRMVFKTCTLII